MDVLISGASMAGLSAAHWFARLGHRVTVVERADGLRPGGAPIDVRGRALATAQRMGILARIEEEKVAVIEPAPVLDGTGAQVATLDLRWFANETDDDIEITRDRLNRILLDAIPDGVEFRFKASIAAIADGVGGAGGVDVAFADGRRGRYDLVVGADGLHSNVRRLAFGPEKDYVRHFGHYVALVDLPAGRTWHRAMLNVPGLTIAVRDAGDGPQGMMLAASPEIDYDYRDLDAQRQLIDRLLSRVDAWQVPAMREAFADPSARGFYFDSVSQTRMPGWTRGNVAVIGDAGHCAALLSGMGTTLAMVSAELLANTWTEAGGDMEAASPLYHDRLRPYVEQCQAFAGEGAPIMVPPTQQALDERNAMFREYAVRFAK
ncbi:2-polyprenyl-6-methoxyphenol hydroxylase-like FAD-dependent oxidoreductase [Variovorax sp. SG517]|uniref:FAD-dependent monooxygenase n=1 Tax=Variovorax sp. SG517 TaxID=2587117 RepID=UPI00159D4D27|nr:FAD-dependent monooxygenase [Variovorax sp. SG517]NVM89871.1 2-polyprenyl-6-methoxyphenol hydroxylase-like FAD-dependent oxidoreductase [Variovorax sp. SG517]